MRLESIMFQSSGNGSWFENAVASRHVHVTWFSKDGKTLMLLVICHQIYKLFVRVRNLLARSRLALLEPTLVILEHAARLRTSSELRRRRRQRGREEYCARLSALKATTLKCWSSVQVATSAFRDARRHTLHLLVISILQESPKLQCRPLILC